jgi:hypothetical protein
MAAPVGEAAPVSMMLPPNVSRSTIAPQSRGSVNVLVHQENDPFVAIATLLFSSHSGQELEQQLRAAAVELHIPVRRCRSTRP